MRDGKTEVLIADDHEIVRTGLGSLIDLEPDLRCVGLVKNGALAVEAAARLRPDVIVMDLVMPVLGGIEATARIVAADPAAKVLILTSYGSPDELKRATAAGASGAVLKTAPNEEILAAIRSLAGGGCVPSAGGEEAHEEGPPLSARQLETLASLVRGLTNDDIALQLGISRSRVKKHVAAILEKLGAASRTEAVAIALRTWPDRF